MWEDYVAEYRLLAKVLSVTRATRELPELRRYRVVLIDESHNLRNREGRRYRAIQEYLTENESRCILLSATPYNKTYLDLSSQLRLFVPEDRDIGVRPERLLQDLGETEFIRRHQCPVRSLAAFEKSDYADDWRELMRLYMVRRTRSFIQDNYAADRPGQWAQVPDVRRWHTILFPGTRPEDGAVQDRRQGPQRPIRPALCRAGRRCDQPPAPAALRPWATTSRQRRTSRRRRTRRSSFDDLSRAGKRLMGFCRTNLFKRLESSGEAFQQSLERHILRNYIFLHAIENDLAAAARHTGCRPPRHRATTTRMSTTRAPTPNCLRRAKTRTRQDARNARSARCRLTSRRGPRRSTTSTPASSSGGSSGCAQTCSSRHLQKDLAADADSLLEDPRRLRRLGSDARTPSSTPWWIC